MKPGKPLKRKTPLRAKKGLTAKTGLENKAPMKRGGPMRQKAKAKKGPRKEGGAWRCPEYLAWVKTLPCVLTGMPADDAHHLIGEGHLGGVGTKAPDDYVMPVTRDAHNEIHRNPELWPLQWEWVRQTREKAREAGWELPCRDGV